MNNDTVMTMTMTVEQFKGLMDEAYERGYSLDNKIEDLVVKACETYGGECKVIDIKPKLELVGAPIIKGAKLETLPSEIKSESISDIKIDPKSLQIPNHPSMPVEDANGWNHDNTPPPVSGNGLYQANVKLGKLRVMSYVIEGDGEHLEPRNVTLHDDINLYSFSCSHVISLDREATEEAERLEII